MANQRIERVVSGLGLATLLSLGLYQSTINAATCCTRDGSAGACCISGSSCSCSASGSTVTDNTGDCKPNDNCVLVGS